MHLNNKKGSAIFYSQGYKDRKSRDNGVQSVIKNAGIASRYLKNETDEGQFFFQLRAGNNIEIGRSPLFKSKESMNQALELIAMIDGDIPQLTVAEKASPKKETKSKAKVAVKSTQLKESALMTQDSIPRHRFSVTYYPDKKIWVMKHDLSGKRKSVTELDGMVLQAFIESYMPMQKKEEILETAILANVEEPEVQPKKKVIKESELKNFNLFLSTTSFRSANGQKSILIIRWSI